MPRGRDRSPIVQILTPELERITRLAVPDQLFEPKRVDTRPGDGQCVAAASPFDRLLAERLPKTRDVGLDDLGGGWRRSLGPEGVDEADSDVWEIVGAFTRTRAVGGGTTLLESARLAYDAATDTLVDLHAGPHGTGADPDAYATALSGVLAP